MDDSRILERRDIMSVISIEMYDPIREKLMSNNPKTVKTGIQDMLGLFETGNQFSGIDRIAKDDFLAFILRILKSPDEDVRKWLYHLLCLSPLSAEKKTINEHCLRNVPLELSIKNKENISWIVAVCAVNSVDLQSFDSLMSKHSIPDILSSEEIRLAGSAFCVDPFFKIEKEQIAIALDDLSGISPVWLTKIYANQFLPIMRKNGFLQKHGQISTEAFVTLLQHPNEEVRKYTMWALAQEVGGHMSTILPYVPLEKALSLESGVRKWYFVKMFQDGIFLRKHLDFIQEVKSNLPSFHSNVREGILMGCKKLGYSEILDEFILDWERKVMDSNEDESVCLKLYEYIFQNSQQNSDYLAVTKAAMRNIEKISYPSVKKIAEQYLTLERRNHMEHPTQVFNGTVYQVNNGGNNRQVNNVGNDEQMEIALKALNDAIETIKQKIDTEHEYTDEIIDGLISHMEYEFGKLDKNIQEQYSRQLDQMYDKLQEVKNAPQKRRGEKIVSFLSTTASVMTVATATPQLVDAATAFVQNIVNIM